MKKLIFAMVIILIATSSIAFKADSQKNIATVDRQQGIYIFMLSQPTSKYEVLGTLKVRASWTGQPSEMLNNALKKVKTEYPKSDGIIFNDLNMQTAQAILFKE